VAKSKALPKVSALYRLLGLGLDLARRARLVDDDANRHTGGDDGSDNGGGDDDDDDGVDDDGVDGGDCGDRSLGGVVSSGGRSFNGSASGWSSGCSSGSKAKVNVSSAAELTSQRALLAGLLVPYLAHVGVALARFGDELLCAALKVLDSSRRSGGGGGVFSSP
jgi:hypothetical protein